MSCRQILVRVEANPIGDIWSIPGQYYLKTGLDESLVTGLTWSDFFSQHSDGKTYSVDSDNFEFILANVDIGGTSGPCQTVSTSTTTTTTTLSPITPFEPDSDTILLLHFDGPNNSQVFTDSSPNVFGVTANNDAYQDATTKRVGTASLHLLFESDIPKDTIGDRNLLFVTPSTQSFFLNNSSFTIEAWVKPQTRFAGSGGPVFGVWQNGNTWYGFNAGINDLSFGSLLEGDWQMNISAQSATIPDNEFTHVAVVRNQSPAPGYPNWAFFVNGVRKNITLNVGDLGRPVSPVPGYVMVGSLLRNFNLDYNGWIDELRVSKVARYTDNFTP